MKVRVSLITHATEDGERVRRGLARALGVGDFSTAGCEGHHGNPIELSSASAPPSAAAAIARAAGPGALGSALRAREPGGRLHLRLDKQEIAEGRLALSESDPVRVTITVPGGDYEGALGLG